LILCITSSPKMRTESLVVLGFSPCPLATPLVAEGTGERSRSSLALLNPSASPSTYFSTEMRLALAAFSALLGARLAAAATSYLLPLYFWPNDDGNCWSEFTSAA
jgi:hypothetical protein